MRTILRKLATEAGAEIAEAAMVLPIVFMFLLGIVWFGRAFNIYSTITQAAQQGAITAARAGCVTCGNNFPGNAAVNGAVVAVMQSSNLDKSQIQVSTPGTLPCPPPPAPPPAPPGGVCTTTTNNITVCRSVILNPTAGATQPAQCGTIVSFKYPFQFNLPFTSLKQIVMTAQAQARTEN